MAKRKKLLTSEDARPGKKQHTSPCTDCPWSRQSLPGWTGGASPTEWLSAVSTDGRIDCHVHTGRQCAGAAVYRRNTCKMPRDQTILVLPADREAVFASPAEFLDHHTSHEPPEPDDDEEE